MEADQQRFQDLHEAKMNQDASYQNHLRDISRMQKNKIEEMFRHQQLEKDEIEA